MNTKLFNNNEFSSSDIKNSNITLDDFDHFEGNHHFSEKYTEKKSAFLDSLNNKPKAHFFRYNPYQIAAVFALILIIGSSTTMAASKLYKTHLEKNEYQADIVITPGTKSSTESSAKSSADSETDSSDQTSIETGITGSSSYDFQPVKIKFSYLPEGVKTSVDEEDKYENPNDENPSAHGISPGVTKLDYDGEIHLTIDYVVSTEEFTSNGRPAYLLKKSSNFEYDKMLCVLFADEHYMFEALLGYEISDEEAKKIADGITLEPTDAEHASITNSYAEIMDSRIQAEGDDYQPLLPSSYYNVGETLPVDLDLNPDCHVTIEQVEYYDSIKDFDRSNFSDDVKLDDKYADTDGTLLSRERRLYSEGDGIHSVPEVIESKKVKQKFVYLTIGVANSSQKDVMDYCADYELAFFNENADGTLTEDTVYYTDASFTEPIYFDASLTNNQDEHFMCTKIPAGQTVTFHIGFLVDEDYTDEMFFFTRGAARSYVLTDIREKK